MSKLEKASDGAPRRERRRAPEDLAARRPGDRVEAESGHAQLRSIARRVSSTTSKSLKWIFPSLKI